MTLTETDRAYLAGFFDGEGCVGYYNSNPNKNKTPQYCSHIMICNTDPRVIEWIVSATGFGKCRIHKPKDGKRRIAYQWQVAKKEQVRQFLEAVRPYLKVKHDQADVMLSHLEMEKSYIQGYGSVTPEIIASRRETELKLKVLKCSA